MITPEEAMKFDVAISIVNDMFGTALKAKHATEDPEERARLDEDIARYRRELRQLTEPDEETRRAIIEKAFNVYSPIIKARVCN